jgi:hypothetical protein
MCTGALLGPITPTHRNPADIAAFFLMITWSPYALPPTGLKGTADAARAGTVREGNELGRSGEMQYEAVSVLS